MHRFQFDQCRRTLARHCSPNTLMCAICWAILLLAGTLIPRALGEPPTTWAAHEPADDAPQVTTPKQAPSARSNASPPATRPPDKPAPPKAGESNAAPKSAEGPGTQASADTPTPADSPTPTGKPLLWMIEGKTPSFLFGTIHLPDARVLALPPVVDAARGRCDVLLTEVPMDSAAQAALLPRTMLPEGRTLHGILPEELYQRLNAYFAKRGLSLQAFDRMRPWAVMFPLSLADYLKELREHRPMDVALYQQAAEDGKEVGGIETYDEQLRIFEEFTDEQAVRLLRQTLDQLEEAEKSGRTYATQLVEKYLAGDTQEIEKFTNQFFDANDEFERTLRKKLITDRNAIMAQRIAERIKAAPAKSHFFAIGAGHIGGDDGLLRRLESHGLKLRRLTPQDAAAVRKR